MEQIQREVRQRPSESEANRESIDRIMIALQSQLGAEDNRSATANNNQGASITDAASRHNQQPLSTQAVAGGQQSAGRQEARGRFLSVDTVAVSMLGPNDASRYVLPPAQQQNIEDEGQQVKVQTYDNEYKVRIRGS